MIKWEYKSAVTDSLDKPEIAAWGEEGWEAVGFTVTQVQQSIMTKPVAAILILFKRMKTESNN